MSEKRKVEDILAELGKKIDHLVAEAREADGKVSDDMEGHIERLKKQKEKIEEQIRSSNSGEKWQQAREHLNEAAAAMNKAFTSLFK
ncbi:MAG: hypothetical protein RLN88_08705 [Ekhidna sp.]|uniref:hypothetical protein n=1 Tax=Ekhidna sp. TaxID=2608089 RepID=UPI0032EF9BAA